MKIDRIDLFPFRYTPKPGLFVLSGGRTYDAFESWIVKLTTDDGAVGWGEHASGPSYMPALHDGAFAAVTYLAPHLIGQDPCSTQAVNAHLDSVLRGHEYAKSAIDIALWDLFGKAAGMPVATLLGGIRQRTMPVVHFSGVDTPEAMVERVAGEVGDGFTHIQLKIGSGNWREDVARVRAVAEQVEGVDTLMVDANGKLVPADAIRLMDAVSDLGVLIEQPCADLDSCLSVRRRTSNPMILDESLTSIADVDRALRTDAMDGAMLKFSRFGGITKIAVARDMCARAGIRTTVEDMAGGQIASAASAHLAASTPAETLVAASLNATFMNEKIAEGLDHGGGWVTVHDRPGLGIEVDESALGEPAFTLTA